MSSLILRIFGISCASLACTFAEEALEFEDAASLEHPLSLMASTSDERFIYLCGGHAVGRGTVGDILRYDPELDQWKQLPAIFTPKRYPSTEKVGDLIYCFDGFSTRGIIPEMEMYSFVHEKLREHAPITHPTRSSGSAKWEGKIYTFGGLTAQHKFSDKLLSFDTNEGLWETLPTMPEKKETQGEIVDGKLYIIGGFHGTASSRVDCYDLETKEWTHLLDLPQGVSAHATANYGSKIWIIGDYRENSLVACYDVRENTFTKFESNLKPRRHAAAEVIDSTLYVMGGNVLPGLDVSSSASVQKLDLTLHRDQ